MTDEKTITLSVYTERNKHGATQRFCSCQLRGDIFEIREGDLELFKTKPYTYIFTLLVDEVCYISKIFFSLIYVTISFFLGLGASEEAS